MIDKELLKKRFSKSLRTYNAHAKVQNYMADKLVKLLIELNGSDFKNILEIGCGTGYLTRTIFNKMKFQKLFANDIVSESETYINEISSNIAFIEGDAEKVEFPKNLDLIISNATFQWIEDFPVFFKKLYLSLNDNGILAFSSFAPANFKEIVNITNYGLNYYENGEIIKLSQDYFNSLMNSSEIIMIDFDNPKEVLTHIKSLGINGIIKKQWTKKDITSFETLYKAIYPDNKIKLTYNPSYFILTKRKKTGR